LFLNLIGLYEPAQVKELGFIYEGMGSQTIISPLVFAEGLFVF
jgi:hypothetical protein